MPFIVQCPYGDDPQRPCGMYMLLEDEDHGRQVKCLLCERPFYVDPLPDEPPPQQLPRA